MRLLIVEDDPKLADFVARGLRAERFAVELAGVLTARDATEDKVKHVEAGADDYLTKPFDFAELLVRIKALLRRTPVERINVLSLQDLELNRLTQQVRRAGQRIELTVKEYAVLEYLLVRALGGGWQANWPTTAQARYDLRGTNASSRAR